MDQNQYEDGMTDGDPYKSLSDTDLMKKLEDADLLEAFEKDPKWQLLKEATRRIYHRADDALDTCPPDDYKRVATYQLTKRFYKNVVSTILDTYRQDGEAAFYEAQDRGMIDQVLHYLRNPKSGRPSR